MDNKQWSKLLLTKLPAFNLAWPDDVKNKWFAIFEKLKQLGQN